MAGKKTATTPAAAAASSTSTGGDANKNNPQPTPQEAMLFYTIIKNMKSKPEIDWNAVADDAGFKNADTAKVRFGQIKRKLGLDVGAGTAKPASSGAIKKPGAASVSATAATTGAGLARKAGTAKAAATKQRAPRAPRSSVLMKKPVATMKAPKQEPVKDEDQEEDEPKYGNAFAMQSSSTTRGTSSGYGTTSGWDPNYEDNEDFDHAVAAQLEGDQKNVYGGSQMNDNGLSD